MPRLLVVLVGYCIVEGQQVFSIEWGCFAVNPFLAKALLREETELGHLPRLAQLREAGGFVCIA